MFDFISGPHTHNRQTERETEDMKWRTDDDDDDVTFLGGDFSELTDMGKPLAPERRTEPNQGGIKLSLSLSLLTRGEGGRSSSSSVLLFLKQNKGWRTVAGDGDAESGGRVSAPPLSPSVARPPPRWFLNEAEKA